MNQKTFSLVAGFVFLVVAVLHLVMWFMGENVIVFGNPTPVWSNLIIFLVAGYLSYQGLKISRKSV